MTLVVRVRSLSLTSALTLVLRSAAAIRARLQTSSSTATVMFLMLLVSHLHKSTTLLRWFARSGLIDRGDVREKRALRAPPNRTAVSRSMPRCAWARRIAPVWSGCCATAHARRSRSERLELLDADHVVYPVAQTTT